MSGREGQGRGRGLGCRFAVGDAGRGAGPGLRPVPGGVAGRRATGPGGQPRRSGGARARRAGVELIAVDVHRRPLTGERPTAEEYLERFPGDAEVVRLAFGQTTLTYGRIHAIRAGEEGALLSFWTTSKARNRQLTAASGSSDETKSLSGTGGRNRPSRVRVAPRTAIPPKSAATGSSAGSVRAGSDGSIWLTTTTSTARSPSRCRTRNESLTPRMSKRFLNEARILARLDHPHIVPVYDVGRTEDGLCFVVSKLIEGSDLAARMGQARPSFRDSAELVATDRRRPALRPHPRAGPPGHQARQHPDRRIGQTLRGGLRACPQGRGLRQGWRAGRHARLHESRAGQGRGSPGRWAIRHLQPGRRLLRVVDREEAIPR